MNHFITYSIEKKYSITKYLLWLLEDSKNRFSKGEGHLHFDARKLGKELKEFFSKHGITYRYVKKGFIFDNNSSNSIICTPAKGNVNDLVRHIRNSIVHNSLEVLTINGKEYVKATDTNKGSQSALIFVPISVFKKTMQVIDNYS